MHAKDIGYELRCAKPVPFDVDYTRTLGFGAVRYLVDGGSGALIALEGGRVRPLALEELLDPPTGRIRTRQVDLTTEAYRVARDYMVYLEPGDFTDREKLAALAAQTKPRPRRSFARNSSQSRCPSRLTRPAPTMNRRRVRHLLDRAQIDAEVVREQPRRVRSEPRG